MKVAIHNGAGWNVEWINYVRLNNIPHIIVDCYASNIMHTLLENNITHLMWHFSHNLPIDIFMARNVLTSAEHSGIKVFPSSTSAWHFDDKVSQKYLLESIKAPLVPSYVFYEMKTALDWASKTDYPKVAKLRRGAGSYNVRLIKSHADAVRYIKQMFGPGLNPSPGYLADAKTKIKVAGGLSGIIKRLKKAPRFFQMVRRSRKGFPKERGYVYFQDFIPNNECDYRVIVVNHKAFGLKRKVREGDFRASGGGMFDYSDIDESVINIAKVTASHLDMSSVAFDFVLMDGRPLIVEISYGFGTEGAGQVNTYWDSNNTKISGKVNAPLEIIEGFLPCRRDEVLNAI